MIGFLIGTASLFGLFKVLRRGRFYGGGCHGGWHRGGGGCHGDWHRGGGGEGCETGREGGPGMHFGKRQALRWFFQQLDTTPGQEKVILGAVDEVKTAAKAARDEVKRARSEVAGAVRGEVLDDGALEGASARIDAASSAVRSAVAEGLRKIHAALDDAQRKRFASLLEDGPGFFDRFAGPYRRGHHA
jgi:hypothetical protein